MTARTPSPSRDRDTDDPIVLVVDDDSGVREALARLFRSIGLSAEMFGSASEFLGSRLPAVTSCRVFDVRLPGLSGLDFQADLAKQDLNIPIVFVTGHRHIPMT